MTLIARTLSLMASCLFALVFSAQSEATTRTEIRPHLSLARELVDHVAPENNRYVLGGQSISFPGDIASGKYALSADCSGFLLALFDRAGYATRSRMMYLKASARRTRHSAEDFVLSIEHEAGFKRIERNDDIWPGDLLARTMLNSVDRSKTGRTGHVLLINSQPKLISSRKPVVAGTRQFEVSIIDTSDEHSGDDDTRLVDPARKVTGIGRATIRLYADDQGELVGWARTFARSDRFFSYSSRFPSNSKVRKAAVGRPLATKTS